jgi:hypothetical protein
MAGSQLGAQFAEALAAKDFDRLAELVDPAIDFKGVTPSRTWEVNSADELISGVLRLWLEEEDEVEELVEVQTGSVADRERVGYLMRVRDADGPYVFEQQAYYTERDGRIDWMRVTCSGWRPI